MTIYVDSFARSEYGTMKQETDLTTMAEKLGAICAAPPKTQDDPQPRPKRPAPNTTLIYLI